MMGKDMMGRRLLVGVGMEFGGMRRTMRSFVDDNG